MEHQELKVTSITLDREEGFVIDYDYKGIPTVFITPNPNWAVDEPTKSILGIIRHDWSDMAPGPANMRIVICPGSLLIKQADIDNPATTRTVEIGCEDGGGWGLSDANIVMLDRLLALFKTVVAIVKPTMEALHLESKPAVDSVQNYKPYPVKYAEEE